MKLFAFAFLSVAVVTVVEASAALTAVQGACCGTTDMLMNDNIIGASKTCFEKVKDLAAADATLAQLCPATQGTITATSHGQLSLLCEYAISRIFCLEIPIQLGAASKAACCFNDDLFNSDAVTAGVGVPCYTALNAILANSGEEIPAAVNTACNGVTDAATMPVACEGAVAAALCGDVDMSKAKAASTACCSDKTFNGHDFKKGISQGCYDTIGAIFTALPVEVQSKCPATARTTAADFSIECEGKIAEGLCEGQIDMSQGVKIKAARDSCCGGADKLMNDNTKGIGSACFTAIGPIFSLAPYSVQQACGVPNKVPSKLGDVTVACESAFSVELCDEVPASVAVAAVTACCKETTMNDGKVGLSQACFDKLGAIRQMGVSTPASIVKGCSGTFVAATVPVACEAAIATTVCESIAHSKVGTAKTTCCGTSGEKTFNDGKIGVGKVCFDKIATIFDGASQAVKSACGYPSFALTKDNTPVKCEAAVALALCGETKVKAPLKLSAASCTSTAGAALAAVAIAVVREF